MKLGLMTALALLTATPAIAREGEQRGAFVKVTGAASGDTVIIQQGGRQTQKRLCGIKATQGKATLQKLISRGSKTVGYQEPGGTITLYMQGDRDTAIQTLLVQAGAARRTGAACPSWQEY